MTTYNELDVDAPVEHEYNYCPHCGKKRLFHSEDDKMGESMTLEVDNDPSAPEPFV